MKNITQRLLTNWHLMRIFRLALGIWAAVQAIQTHEYIIGLVALFFLYQAVTDTGCCGSNTCYTPTSKIKPEKGEEIKFEEIK